MIRATRIPVFPQTTSWGAEGEPQRIPIASTLSAINVKVDVEEANITDNVWKLKARGTGTF